MGHIKRAYLSSCLVAIGKMVHYAVTVEPTHKRKINRSMLLFFFVFAVVQDSVVDAKPVRDEEVIPKRFPMLTSEQQPYVFERRPLKVDELVAFDEPRLKGGRHVDAKDEMSLDRPERNRVVSRGRRASAEPIVGGVVRDRSLRYSTVSDEPSLGHYVSRKKVVPTSLNVSPEEEVEETHFKRASTDRGMFGRKRLDRTRVNILPEVEKEEDVTGKLKRSNKAPRSGDTAFSRFNSEAGRKAKTSSFGTRARGHDDAEVDFPSRIANSRISSRTVNGREASPERTKFRSNRSEQVHSSPAWRNRYRSRTDEDDVDTYLNKI